MKRITEVAAADEARIVELIGIEIDNARERITTEASWGRLEEFFYRQLVIEHVQRSSIIVAWAEAGHPAAHNAIRRYAHERKERGCFDSMLVSLKAYAIKTDEQPFVPFPRGRHVVANMMRNFWLPLSMQNVAGGTGLDPTRGASATAPSVAYFFSLAMQRKGFKLTERELNRIYWNRHKLADAIEASMPAIPMSTIKESI
jgi:hypothetical protein